MKIRDMLLILLINCGFACIGPFLIMGPIFGFPLLVLHSLVQTKYVKPTNSYLRNTLITTSSFLLLALVAGMSDSFLMVGMIFQSAGLVLMILTSHYITKAVL